jgi:hypothetical protein
MAKSGRKMAAATPRQIMPLVITKASGKAAKHTKKGRSAPTTPNTMSIQNTTGEKETDMNILSKSRSKKQYLLLGLHRSGTEVHAANGIPETVSTRLMEVDQVQSCATARKLPHKSKGVLQGTDRQVPSNSRSGGHLTTMISDITTIPENQWTKTKHSFENNIEQTTREVDRYTKTGLFKGLKFITERHQMDYSPNCKSICQTVCTKLHIPLDDSFKFWTQYGRLVGVILNRKRADINSAIKRTFIGKCFQYEMCANFPYYMILYILTQNNFFVLYCQRHLPHSGRIRNWIFPSQAKAHIGNAAR